MESSPKEEGFSEEGSIEKSCYYCKTTKTPLWRSGPSGPKSLCNACGIRLRKKRVISPHAGRAKKPGTGSSEDDEVKLDTGSVENEEVKPDTGSAENDAKKKSKIGRKKKKKKKKGMKLKNGMKVNLLGVKRITSPRQWSEVERAALLLMALSCGAVFA